MKSTAPLNLRAILDTVRDAIMVAEPSETIVFANASAELLLGYSRGALEGQSLAALVPERLRTGAERALCAPGVPPAVPTGTQQPVRGVALARDGREVPVELSADLAQIDGRSVTVWVLRDLRERIELEGRLALRDALAAMADAFVQMAKRPDVDQVAHTVVETLVSRLGAAGARVWLIERGSEVLSLRAWAGLDPNIDAAADVGACGAGYALPLRDVVRSGNPVLAETGHAGHLEDSPLWVMEQGIRGYALQPLSFGGQVLGACAVLAREPIHAELALVIGAFARHAGVALHDVSTQQHAASTIAALASEAEARAGEFEVIVSNMPDAVFVMRDGLVAFANRAAARMLGVAETDLRVSVEDFARLADLRDADGRRITTEDLTISRVLRGEVATGREQRLVNRRTQREVWVQASGAPLRDSHGRVHGGVIVWTEITRMKEYEHSKDEWLAIAAHELRTPLTPIMVHLQMAQRRLQMGREIGPEVFEKALEQVKRLSRLVNGLLDVTRLQAGQLELLVEDVDLRDVAEGIVERVRHLAPRHTFVVDVAPDVGLVRGDRARLDEVIAALVDNAVKYSPDGGEVWVRVANREQSVVVEVRDEGIGIAPDEREQIFERYFRAGSVPATQYGGLGLGLWIAGKVVQKHGGRIELDSEPGRGSTFTVVLPRGDAAPVEAVAAAHEPTAVQARILVVDDDVAVLDAVRGLLAEDGYDARVVNSGEDALREARTFRPDVMLLDLRMPGMDGWEVRRRFAEDPELASIPIVLVSADRDARARAAGMDVQGFVAKPFDVDELERVVGQLSGGAHPGLAPRAVGDAGRRA